MDVGVSLDGTCQKRGFTAMNGAVAAISMKTGCIVDVDVMSRYCEGCINNNNKGIKMKHKCTFHHDGS